MPRLASFHSHRGRLVALAAAATAGLAALPAAAQAVTLTAEGDTIVYRATPGVDDLLILNSDGDGTIVFSAGSYDIQTPLCSSRFGSRAQCSPTAGGVRVELGDGADHLEVAYDFSPSTKLVADGGPGNDALESEVADRVDVLNGGDGDDRVLGGPGADALDGGAGNDTLEGGDDLDVVRGGAGDDTLLGDDLLIEADVLDGGPGLDRFATAAYTNRDTLSAPLDISLDGQANDGRTGEGDNVTGIEVMWLSVPARLVAGADPVDFQVYDPNPPLASTLIGGPAADHLEAFNGDDTLDGKGGNDAIEGGYGSDTITGGPGQDTITGDEADECPASRCPTVGVGNDTIDVADGEQDAVDCGVGEDTVRADRADQLVGCEKVTYVKDKGGEKKGGKKGKKKGKKKGGRKG